MLRFKQKIVSVVLVILNFHFGSGFELLYHVSFYLEHKDYENIAIVNDSVRATRGVILDLWERVVEKRLIVMQNWFHPRFIFCVMKNIKLRNNFM